MLTRRAQFIPLLALLGCATHHAGPRRTPACVAPKTDSLHIDITDPADSNAAAYVRPCGAQGWPASIQVIDPRAARDALDAGIDVLITSDAAAVAYAPTHPEYETGPLPWNRLYLLLLPSGTRGTGGGEALRTDLATNAVRVEARPAQSRGCGAVAPVIGSGLNPQIVYADNDSIARALAERLVALASRSGDLAPLRLAQVADTTRLHTRGIRADSLPLAVAGGADLGYIVGVPFPVESAPCPDAPGIVPLIETRPTAMVRRPDTPR
jgi:hypothetical protein